MEEKLIQYVWQLRLFPTDGLKTVDGEDVENFAITKTGNLKATDPDSTSSFRSETWFADNTGFDFKDVWTIEEGNLPTLRFLIK